MKAKAHEAGVYPLGTKAQRRSGNEKDLTKHPGLTAGQEGQAVFTD